MLVFEVENLHDRDVLDRIKDEILSLPYVRALGTKVVDRTGLVHQGENPKTRLDVSFRIQTRKAQGDLRAEIRQLIGDTLELDPGSRFKRRQR